MSIFKKGFLRMIYRLWSSNPTVVAYEQKKFKNTIVIQSMKLNVSAGFQYYAGILKRIL